VAHESDRAAELLLVAEEEKAAEDVPASAVVESDRRM
jgi:hypothetical protein